MFFARWHEYLWRVFVLNTLELDLTYVSEVSVFDSVLVNDRDLETSMLLRFAGGGWCRVDISLLLILSKLS